MAFRRRLPKCGTSLFLCFILLLALLCVLHRASNRSLSFHYKLTIDGIKAAWTRQLTGDLSAVQCRQQSHDVISDVSLVPTNEDFLIPYFQSRKVKAREGLCVRHEAPGTEFERQLLSTSPLGSIESAPDELTSQVVVERTRHFRVGDRIQIRVDLYDSAGRRRTAGGDEVRIWLTSPVSVEMTSVAAKVTDMRNGSYLGETTLKWQGLTLVRVSLTYAREFLRILVELRHTVHSMRWITGIFQNGRGATETTVCLPSFPVPGFSSTCNLTSRNADIPWYCGRPTDTRLSCKDWTETGNFDYTPINMLPYPAFQLVAKVDSPPYLKEIPHKETIQTYRALTRQLPDALPACWSRPPRETWESPTPLGWFHEGSWRPNTCSLPELTRKRARTCMRNTTLLLLGDCNMRQWWKKVRAFLNCSMVKEGKWHAPMICEVASKNSTLLFAPHAMPFNVGTRTDLHTRPLPAALAGLPGDRKVVVVIHYYLHHQNYPLAAYVDRVRAAKGTIEKFLDFNPDAMFFIRGPHVLYDGKENHANFGDSFGPQYIQIWKKEFESLRDRVWFLDFWDMTIAAENMGQNPTEKLDLEKLKVLFGYFCRN